MENRLKIFVSAYAFEPGLGSEIGVGWHWVLEMSKYFELWVLTRESNRHTIEPWITAHPEYSSIHFLYYDWPKWARFWKKGLRGVRTYYNIWQTCTDSIVKQTMQENGISIYHHLTYGNALWKVSNYGQKQYFIWGPTSAGTVIPKDFTKHYRPLSRVKESLQRFIKKTLFMNIGFRNRCKHANLILCKTDDTIECVPQKYRDKCIQFTDVAVDIKDVSLYVSEKRLGKEIRFFAAGTMVGWRNFDVLIDAFTEAVKRNNQISLHILGSGGEYMHLHNRVSERNMENHIKMPGQVNMETYYKYLAESDIIINPCFREGAVTVSFDSMNFAKPLICFDTKGYTHNFLQEHCRIIKGITTRSEAVKRLSEEILYMADPDRIKAMGQKAIEAGKQSDWQHKGENIYKIIRKYYGNNVSASIK